MTATTSRNEAADRLPEVAPALPMTAAEHKFLIREGSLAGALAGSHLRFVYCSCGVTPKAADWYEHQDSSGGARYVYDDQTHEAVAFERPADYLNDLVVLLDEEAARG